MDCLFRIAHKFIRINWHRFQMKREMEILHQIISHKNLNNTDALLETFEFASIEIHCAMTSWDMNEIYLSSWIYIQFIVRSLSLQYCRLFQVLLKSLQYNTVTCNCNKCFTKIKMIRIFGGFRFHCSHISDCFRFWQIILTRFYNGDLWESIFRSIDK